METKLHEALIFGVRDSVRKNAYEDAVIGLSGAVDSTLTQLNKRRPIVLTAENNVRGGKLLDAVKAKC